MASLVISYPIPSAPQWWSNLGKGVEAYSSIMGYLVPGGKGPLDTDFQKLCNAFFQIRMPEEWRIQFYDLLNGYWNKGIKPDFKTVFDDLYNRTSNPGTKSTDNEYALKCSFTSKMVHMLNPDCPIWDSKVMGKLSSFCGKYSTSWDDETKLKQAPLVYKGLIDWYRIYLSTTNAEDVIEEFDKHFSTYDAKITRTKKIDFMLWKL